MENTHVYSWNTYIINSHKKMIANKNAKEIGKIRAYACELMICDFLNHYAENILQSNSIFIHNDDVCDYQTIISQLCIEPQICQSGYDILCINPETNSVKRIQVKHRNSNIHLETTRRNSAKNLDKNASGHVSYSRNEFDYLIVVKGDFDDRVAIQEDTIIFPVNSLIDPNKDNILVNRISKSMEREYRLKFTDYLNELCL